MKVAERRTVRFQPDSLLAVAGLVGLAVPFLPFTHSTSPWDAIHERFLWMLGAPFFLAFFVSGASLRRLIWGAPLPAERWAAYGIAAIMTCPTIAFYVEALSGDKPSGTEDWLSVILLVILLITAPLIVAGLVIRNARLGKRIGASAVNALQAAYLPNAVLTLISFGYWQLGAYLAALTALVYATDIIVSSASRSSPSQAG